MISIVVLSFIAAQTGIAIYVSNTLPLKSNFDRILNIFLIILFFHLGTKLFFLAVLKDSFLYNNNATGFGLSYGPMLYLLTRITINKPTARRIMLYHLLPFFAFTLLYIISCIGYLAELLPEAMLNGYAPAYQWLVTLSLLIYPVVSLVILKKNNTFRHTSKAENMKLLYMIAYIMTIGVITGLCYAIVRFSATGSQDFDLRLVPYIFIAGISFFILRYKLRAGAALAQVHSALTAQILLTVDIIATKEEELPHEKKYKKSAIDTEMMDKYEVSLKKFMEKSRIYLQPEVSLEDLAEGSGIPKHHLTQLLNERFEKNFYSFINEYRIEEAIKKLQSPGDHLSMLSLAYDCGFNSKSSFNNYFKKVTGHTPSTYRKEHLLVAAEK